MNGLDLSTLMGPVAPTVATSTFGFGTITSVSPLRVKLDGPDSAAVASTPIALVAVQNGDRVWCQLTPPPGRQLIVLAIVGGPHLTDGARGVVTGGYAAITSSSSGTSSTSPVAVSGLQVTPTLSNTRRYRAEFWGQFTSSVSGDRVGVTLTDGATQLVGTFVTAGSVGFPAYLAAILVGPTSGTHTINGNIYRNAGTGSVNVVAGASAPAFIQISDIGPV